jgi:hypothetical protein
MKRSVQEIVELVALALFALLGLTAATWLVGTLLTLSGALFGWLSGLLWQLARFLIPTALVAGGVAWAIVIVRGRSAPTRSASAAAPGAVAAAPLREAKPEPIAPGSDESVRRFGSDPRVN